MILREARKQIKRLQSKAATSQVDSYLDQVVQVQDVPLLAIHVGEYRWMRCAKYLISCVKKSYRVFSGCKCKQKEGLFCGSVSQNGLKGVHAGKLVGQVAAVADGGGGENQIKHKQVEKMHPKSIWH